MTLNEWIINGEVGTSSKTMWAARSGAVQANPRMGVGLNIPFDPDDFRRCKLFVDQCGLDADDLTVIKVIVPWFGPYIDNWDELVGLYEEEKPNGSCPKLYERMNVLRDEAMRIDGWKQSGPGSWTREPDAQDNGEE